MNMEENKYYTPEINEFYVGFEYEYKNHDGVNRDISTPVWKKSAVKSINDLPYIERGLNTINNTRVKYLDKQDLIELGFKEIGQEEYYLNGDLNSWCIEALYHQSIKSYYRIGDGETQRMFLEIKNKSELIKVLKMLGIK